jgi:hypothetical protein
LILLWRLKATLCCFLGEIITGKYQFFFYKWATKRGILGSRCAVGRLANIARRSGDDRSSVDALRKFENWSGVWVGSIVFS